MSKIIPTIGRVMWYHRAGFEGVCYDVNQPMAAIVACVHNGGASVNLTVFDQAGNPVPIPNVRVRQEGDPDDSKPYAAWMPFQLGQAKAQVGAGIPPASSGVA